MASKRLKGVRVGGGGAGGQGGGWRGGGAGGGDHAAEKQGTAKAHAVLTTGSGEEYTL